MCERDVPVRNMVFQGCECVEGVERSKRYACWEDEPSGLYLCRGLVRKRVNCGSEDPRCVDMQKSACWI